MGMFHLVVGVGYGVARMHPFQPHTDAFFAHVVAVDFACGVYLILNAVAFHPVHLLLFGLHLGEGVVIVSRLFDEIRAAAEHNVAQHHDEDFARLCAADDEHGQRHHHHQSHVCGAVLIHRHAHDAHQYGADDDAFGADAAVALVLLHNLGKHQYKG